MSVFPCSVCRRRGPGKLATAYWAWFDPSGSRSAWKLRYCVECAPEALSVVFDAIRALGEDMDEYGCIGCGSSTREDSEPCYLTLYLPGKEPTEYALPFDSACAQKVRAPVVEKGERLPDRGGVVRGPSPSISAWDAIGIEPVALP